MTLPFPHYFKGFLYFTDSKERNPFAPCGSSLCIHSAFGICGFKVSSNPGSFFYYDFSSSHDFLYVQTFISSHSETSGCAQFPFLCITFRVPHLPMLPSRNIRVISTLKLLSSIPKALLR